MSEELNSEDVLSCLKKVLDSRVFEKSERARNLLAYLVHQELSGDGAGLKAFTIAVDVFDKDETFDAATDPLVRVHAGRLRELLAAYYQSEGQTDKIEFSIPRGGYRPLFQERQGQQRKVKKSEAIGEKRGDTGQHMQNTQAEIKVDAHAAADPDSILNKPNPGLKRQIQYIWALSALLTLIAGGLIIYLFLLSAPVNHELPDAVAEGQIESSNSSFPVVRVLTEISDEESRSFSERFLTALSNFDTVTTVKLGHRNLLSHNTGNWTPLDYAFDIYKINNADDEPEIFKIVLLSLDDGRVLRSEEFSREAWESPNIAEIVSRKLGAAATPEGVIFADIASKGFQSPLLSCLGKVRTYYGLTNRQTHAKAYECTKVYAKTPKSNGLLTAIHGGLIAEAAGKNYPYPEISEDRNEAMGFALRTALAGFDNAPLSARAAREVGFVYSWQGVFPEMTKWFEQANTLNRYDSSVAASFGYGLVLTGNYEKAAEVMREAIASSARPPNWWLLYGSLALLMTGEIDKAKEMVAPIGLAKRSLYYTMLNAVFAYEKNDRIRAAFLVRELRQRYPKFAANPEGSFQKRHFPKELIDTLVTGLENSGL